MLVDISIHKKLDDFNLNIEFKCDAKRIGILGASGCGKTMTLKAIAGIIKPDSGRVIIDENHLYDSNENINLKPQERNVGYLFQNYALFPTMTVEKNIASGIQGSKKEKIEKTARLIKEYQLDGLEKKLPGQLSGGQQQRVALARMMACEPEVLLLDEPFSAMDTFLREGLRLELLNVLKTYDKTSILVTHDRDEAFQMCDWLIIMDKGRVLASGDTKELFEAPKSPAAARLTGCKNISRIEKLDDTTIRLLDWGGIELTTKEMVSDDIKYAGIRAHDFFEATDDIAVNRIKTGETRISEMPFEWYVTLENGLWWKREKALKTHNEENIIPEYIAVLPESIILMREDAE